MYDICLISENMHTCQHGNEERQIHGFSQVQDFVFLTLQLQLLLFQQQQQLHLSVRSGCWEKPILTVCRILTLAQVAASQVLFEAKGAEKHAGDVAAVWYVVICY